MSRRAAAAGLLAAVLCGATPAESAPGQDAATTAGDEGARLSGVVRDAQTGRPIARALVGLGREPGTTDQAAITDPEGVFVFDGLPPGRFVLFAAKAPYVQPRWTLGQPASAVTLEAGERRDDLELRLQRGSAIAGTVIDPHGRPLPGVHVTLLSCPGFEADCAGAPGAVVQSATTDHRGTYRLFGLREGTYLLTADADLPIAEVPSPDALQWAESQLRARTPSRALPPADTRRAPAYITTFFPGVTDGAQAAPIELAAGQDRGGVDVAMQIGETGTVTGTVPLLDPSGRLPRLMILPAQRLARATQPATIAVDAFGTFSVPHLAPGRYRIVELPAGPGEPRLAPADVTVEGGDRVGVTLVPASGVPVSGRVVLTEADDSALSGIVIAVQRSDVAVVVPNLDTAQVETDADGRFVIPEVLPGRYALAVVPSSAMAGRPVAAATLDGRDVLDTGFDVGPAARDLTVTLARAATVLTGELVMADGRQAFEFHVVAFPADRALWRAGSRRIRAAPAAADGSFEIRGLPPGEYHVGAAGIGSPADITRGLLDVLAGASPLVTLEEGAARRLTLTGRAR